MDRARQLLYDSLMFGIDHIPKVTPQHLEENDSERAKVLNISQWT